MNINEILQFYKDKRVLVTGHTGFKGAWMMSVLNRCGAKVCGYALNPPTDPSLYEILKHTVSDPVKKSSRCLTPTG